MTEFLLKLTGVMLCAAIMHSAAADPAVTLQTKQVEESHAAVTDMSDIIDMSYADPKTWQSLPPAAQVNDQVLVHEEEFLGYPIGAARSEHGRSVDKKCVDSVPVVPLRLTADT